MNSLWKQGVSRGHRSKVMSRQPNPRQIMTENTKPRPPTSKPPGLTHFLCLPLVNSASISQLENSISAFKRVHQSSHGSPEASGQTNPTRLGLPATAFRPLGTLHLTLGVMSLTRERLEQASAFLQSLDLADLIREAQRVATRSHHRNKPQQHPSHISQTSTSDAPLNISLESLHAIPRDDSATILHASPVDPTGRLYPFCVMLRDKFIEAGFVQNEAAKNKPHSSQNRQLGATQSSNTTSSPRASPSQKTSPQNLDPYTVAITREPKPRPLLLHATLVNTIYVKGRKTNQDQNAKGKSSSKRFTFDARNVVSQSPGNRPPVVATSPRPAPSHSYVWAKDFPLDAICICEMGAKKLHTGSNDNHGLNERLGEEYRVVAQRKLGHTQPSHGSPKRPR
ncbi:unnamed protein product [Penicillium olsonii]|uniref:A-kinase anchor protein 7-like phosphoesterase domain-containing protein n=1 Tax=Penicillium olsonii TaxID=99116 RepID=A0A9W4ML68_PENOL|nr:unnamed protein product [Penicillium olsonii]